MDVLAVLDKLGIEVRRTDEENASCLCPFHDDRRPSFSVNLTNGLWHCFAGCGGGTLPQLISKVRGVGLAEAKKWPIKTTPVPAKPRPTAGPCPPFHLGVIPRWFLNRGFTKETAREWQLGYSAFYDALVIPVLQARALIYRRDDKWVRLGAEKYRYTRGFPKASTLFGLHKPFQIRQGTIILVEGPLDCIWLHQHGYPNSLAILGATISERQARALVDLKAWRIVLAFDNDDAGRRATEAAERRLSKYFDIEAVSWTGPLSDRKDVAECNQADLQTLLGPSGVSSADVTDADDQLPTLHCVTCGLDVEGKMPFCHAHALRRDEERSWGPAQQEVWELLREAVLSPYEAADALGKSTRATENLMSEMANDWELVKVGKRSYTAQTELVNVLGPSASRGLPVLARTEKTFKASTKDEVLQDLQRMQRECGSQRNGGRNKSRSELKTKRKPGARHEEGK